VVYKCHNYNRQYLHFFTVLLLVYMGNGQTLDHPLPANRNFIRILLFVNPLLVDLLGVIFKTYPPFKFQKTQVIYSHLGGKMFSGVSRGLQGALLDSNVNGIIRQ